MHQIHSNEYSQNCTVIGGDLSSKEAQQLYGTLMTFPNAPNNIYSVELSDSGPFQLSTHWDAGLENAHGIICNGMYILFLYVV